MPVEADLESGQRIHSLGPASHARWIDREVRYSSGNRLEIGVQGQWQTQERSVDIEGRERFAPLDQSPSQGERAEQRLEHRLHLKDDRGAHRVEDWDVAAKLQRV